LELRIPFRILWWSVSDIREVGNRSLGLRFVLASSALTSHAEAVRLFVVHPLGMLDDFAQELVALGRLF
jgi:hypothetical protein